MNRFVAAFALVASLFVVACGGSDPSPPAAGSGAAGGATGSGATGSGATGGGGTSAGGPPRDWSATRCTDPTTEVGYGVGMTLGELVVNDCETGEPRSLDELCGARATWIFSAHSHCPTCKATARFTSSIAERFDNEDVAIAHIMYDDNGTDCATWQDTYELAGMSNVKVYQDPTGAVWSKLKSSNYTAPSVFLDARRVVTFQAHGLSEASVITQIERALDN